ncbi:uncharacterized protein LOC122432104 isoform X3 [Cervus canadensis]|uniref:uncharacterized protein LOC122432104 isoform X3 n=1 Tax=Cervus canadensis TaxID=1574408 RepID=UPI001CA32823|nr:uncharacterized protein LOC122432104 isoform X3 [Cervus canadensis]
MCLVNREELSSTEWNAVHVVAPESTDACLGCLCDRFVRLPSLPSQVSTSFSLREKELEMGPKASPGYRGKFGVEQDRMDKLSAMSISQSSPSAACRLTPSGGFEASVVSSWTEWTRNIF